MQQEIIQGFRISPQQKRLWKLLPPERAHVSSCCVLLEGPLNPELLEKTLAALLNRHEILRTSFDCLPSMELPVQVIVPESSPELHVVEVIDGDIQEQLRNVTALLPAERDQGSPLRVSLLRFSAEQHLLRISLTSLCADAGTLKRLVHEIGRQYSANGASLEDGDDLLQYVQFSEWQNDLLQDEQAQKGKEYWQGVDLAGTSRLSLPFANEGSGVGPFELEVHTQVVQPELATELADAAQRADATVSEFLLTCWLILLWRLTEQARLVVGHAFDARDYYEELREALGLFVRWLPIRCDLRAEISFAEVLKQVRQSVREASEWQEYFQWEEQKGLEAAELNYFPVGYEFEDRAGSFSCGDIAYSIKQLSSCTEPFDLKLHCIYSNDGLVTEFDYQRGLFATDDIHRLGEQFATLLKSVVDDPEKPISRLTILPEAERFRILTEFNRTGVAYPSEVCVHEMFAAQVARTPAATALIFEDQQLSYFELDARANQLARYLRTLGVGREVIVGLHFDRSLEMVTAMLATLKAGGAYLPLDPQYPRKRLAYILEDAQLALVLTTTALAAALPEPHPPVVCLDGDSASIDAQIAEPLSSEALPDNPAYVIYTSGSTGMPKGVMIPHRALSNHMHWMQQAFPLAPDDRVLQKTPFTFDASVWEFYAPLLAGCPLILARPGDDREPSYLVKAIADHQITVLQLVPFLLRALLDEGLSECQTLKRVFCGGEPLTYDLQERFFRSLAAELHNLYGPTEATIDASAWTCRRDSGWRTVPIGRPIANAEFYILDQHLQPAPPWVPGRLYIGGTLLARGYIHHPELTAGSFVPHPFSQQPGARLYDTGDRARYLPDGTVEFFGRTDYQIKLHGFRIGLGEIEAALCMHPSVRDAVVVAIKDEQDELRLVAYVVFSRTPEGEPSEVSTKELRSFLGEVLTPYMIPSAFVVLKALPLTPNGKVDRRALPAPDFGEAGIYVAPRTPAEEMLAGIWSEVLNRDRVSIHDNFFELGGHSLLATQVISRTRKAFEIELPLRMLFEAQTIAELAARIEQAKEAGAGFMAPPLKAVPGGVLVPSFAQQRLWFLDQLIPGSALYNVPLALRLVGRLDVQALEQALTEITRRHEGLRTVFPSLDGQPALAITPHEYFHLPQADLQQFAEPDREAEVMRLAHEEAARGFNLAAGPLIRGSLLVTGEEDHVLLLTMHHIITDGWSTGILVRDLSMLYNANLTGAASPLPDPTLQYSDFARWQREWLQGEALEQQLGYWKQQLAGSAVLELPTDHPRPLTQSHRGAREFYLLPRELCDSLKHLGRSEDSTLFMVLLAGFQLLLFRYTWQSDISVGSPIANRNRAETEEIIGFFVNTLVLRTQVSHDLSFRDLLHRVREVTLGAYSHQDLPFEMLVEELQPKRDLSRPPLFQVMFSLQNAPLSFELQLGDLRLEGLNVDGTTAKFDFTYNIVEVEQGLVVRVEYDSDLFEAETIQRMLKHYEILLTAAATNPQLEAARLPVLSEEERQQVLVDLNATAFPSSDAPTIHALFEAQVQRTPAVVALEFDGRQLTYAELNSRANQLARHLQSLGVGPEVRVGICAERSLEMVIAVLGVLKAGGAYVPLDPEYPRERLSFMLSNARVAVLLAHRQLKPELVEEEFETVYLDGLMDHEVLASDTNPISEVGPDNLIYVVYTSGSTGQPKGVAMIHRALVNLINWQCSEPALPRGKRRLQFASLSFDASFREMFSILCSGGTLLLIREELRRDFSLLAQFLETNSVEKILLPFVALQRLCEEFSHREQLPPALREVITAGEQLRITKPIRDVFSRLEDCRLHNHYGPSESHAVSAYALAESPAEWPLLPSIGRPIHNTEFYVLDQYLQPLPVGVPGELYIGGAGLARGYLNRPDLTAERFVPNAFSTEPGERLYRTGDLVRYLPDGNLEFIRRIDSQVKIRGYRIELGEIEAVLDQHAAVREAAVLAREGGNGEKQLVAYLVFNESQLASSSDLRSFLAERLPDYMVPALFVARDTLPLTPNNKLDRRALATLELDTAEFESAPVFVAPRNAEEEIVAGIWSEVLHRERVGVHDNFFELGGHSLLATQVVSRVRQAFNVDIPVRLIFESPTVAALAISVSEARRSGSTVGPIEVQDRTDKLPLSFAQQRLWFIEQLNEGQAVYTLPAVMRLQGALNLEALERTLTEIVRRHETLRTTFTSIDGEPVQVIAEPVPISLSPLDLSQYEPAERDAELRRIVDEVMRRQFDLARGPLFHASLVRVAEQDHVLALELHHIVADGWSMGVLINELSVLYNSFSLGEASPLADLPIQYADFAYWQRQWLQGEVLEGQLTYWQRQLEGSPRVLELPLDHPRPAMQTFAGARERFVLPGELAQQLRQLSRQTGSTLFMILLAAFQLLLSRYSNQDDVVVGTPIANRNRAETEPLIGFFVNTLVLRTRLDGRRSFHELLSEVRDICLSAYTHQDLPFEQLVEFLRPERDLSYSPVFQVMFMLQGGATGTLQLNELELNALDVEDFTSPAKFDLTLSIVETQEELIGTFEYNTDLFEATTIVRLSGHFQKLLNAITANPNQSIASLPLLDKEEEQQVLVEWNETESEYEAKCLHELFAEQVERTPEQVAVVHGQVSLTYRELDQRAEQLAARLQALGVGPEVPVGLYLERGLALVVGALGILKAGGAYVPLDPAYPSERLRYMLADTEMPVVVTQTSLVESTDWAHAKLVLVDEEQPGSESLVRVPVETGNLAYIIYTSGSTGQAKGVGISHRNVAAFLQWARESFTNGELSGVLASTSICFDLAVFELFAPLVSGGRVILAENALQLAELPEAEAAAVTLINTVPSAMKELLRLQAVPSGVRVVNLAGEALSRKLVQEVYDGTAVERVWNLYGPTEDTTYSTWSLVPRAERRAPSIGRPLANKQVYLLDQALQPVPIGVVGELYMGGAGLARGYYRRAALTAERFIPNPFSVSGGERLYRTGDVARYREDGEIEYLGRQDQQVKVRGYRIELGEIEAVLLEQAGLREAVVVVREERAEEKQLVAYVVGAEGAPPPESSELRSYLQQRLPGYMVPGTFVVLAELPLTANGKVDRRALPAPDISRRTSGVYVAPRTPAEELVANIWMRVLGVEQLSVEDNFFDLGGHSLLATQVVTRIREAFKIELPLRILFDQPTVAGLTREIERAVKEGQQLVALPLTPVSRDGQLRLSLAQQRLWFLDQLIPNNPFYNMYFGLRLVGELNVEALTKAVNEIVRRHEVFRTSFQSIEGEPVLSFVPATPLHINEVDLSGSDSNGEEAVNLLARAEAQRPFDLTQPPLLRVSLARLGPQEQALILTMHHIISDGWSLSVLVGELAALYHSYCNQQPSPLPELPIQFADFADWQREWLQGEVLERQLNYWRHQLAGIPPLLDMPTDRPRPAVQRFYGARHNFSVSNEVFERLKALSRQEGVTLFMTLLAVWQALLSRYTGQEDICVGTPMANRNQTECEGLIGFFVDTLLLRGDLSGNPSFRTLLARVRETALGAYSHQDIPFEKLVDELHPERDMSRNPLFQVLFTVVKGATSNIELPGLTLEMMKVETASTRFDLECQFFETAEELKGAITYSTELFDSTTIQRLIEHLQVLLAGVVANPEQPISTLPLLSVDEEQRVLVDWNDTAVDYPAEKCVHQAFAEQVARTPANVAAVFEDERLSYEQLNVRANQLAHKLRACGVGPEVRVGICLDRSIDMLVSVIAVLKAGGAYVPIDPQHPQERLSFTLADAQVAVILTEQKWMTQLPQSEAQVVVVDVALDPLAERDELEPISGVCSDNLAYVIYTSGSTGTPKGAMISHRGLMNYLTWATQAYDVADGNGVPVHSPLGFDLTVTSLLAPLLTGQSVVLLAEGIESLKTALAANTDFSLVKLTPAHLEALNHLVEEGDANACARTFILGGEALLGTSVAEWCLRAPGSRIINEYGPTETIVGCCVYEVSEETNLEGPIPIGRPIANTELYILDQGMRPVPIGARGELYIGGPGLARGYVNRPEVSAEKFLPHCFSATPGARLYRTGDQARYRPDGQIEYLGRADRQIKLHGYRIEPGEIEVVLGSHEAVREAVVVVREIQETDKRLLAYVVADESANEQTPAGLRSFLAEKLPSYMVPSAIVMCDEIPLTPNGKVDVDALAKPEEILRSGSIAPRDAVELQLARIWGEILLLDSIGVTDNFFDLGGNSMSAVRLMARVQKEFGQGLPLSILFQQGTVEHLAAIVRQPSLSEGWSHVVEIQRGHLKPPLFFVHAAGGNVFSYVRLANRLGPDQPFYGVQASGLIAGQQVYDSIEEMAARYIDAIRLVQPGGPYFIGGWSFGGIVAFEMARQLGMQGEAAKLVLVDTSAIGRAMPVDDDPALALGFARDLGINLDDQAAAYDELQQLTSAEQLRWVLTQAIVTHVLPPDYEFLQIQQYYAVYKANLVAWAKYRPEVYSGPITLFRASDRPLENYLDPTMGWNELVSGGVDLHTIPGGHYSLLTPPNVELLAEELKKSLTQSLTAEMES